MILLKQEAEKLGINLSEKQLEKFRIYMDFLLEYNKHTNLTAIKEPEDIMIKHFLDSMILSKFIKMGSKSKIIDVGTGAGFPGVPLKILDESINLTLVDSLNKRITFLKELSEKLNLKIDIFHGRAEELAQKNEFREKFDVAVSRAVAPLNILSEYCLGYVKMEGCFTAMKGPNSEEEIKNSENAIKIMGGKIKACEHLELPNEKGFRNIIIIEKIKETPKKYPRSNSQISKKPL